MEHLFFYCRELESINLENFDTSNVEIFTGMVEGCEKLTSIDLRNFNTSKCKIMYAMFYNCRSLVSLDLSNFYTNLVTNMKQMFSSCYSLTSLDISSFNTSNVDNMEEMFKDCISLKSLNIFNFDTNKVSKFADMFYDVNESLIFCSNQGEQSNISSFFSSFKNNNCSYFCNNQKKYIFETNQCVFHCNESNLYKYEFNNLCYQNCPNGTISSNLDNFFCVNKTNNECNIKNMFENKCILNNNENNEINEDSIINKIRDGIKNKTLDSLIDIIIKGNNKDLVIKDNDIIYQITSSSIQNNKEYDNISIIKLRDCEEKLHTKYFIDDDDPLLILKIDVQKEGLLIPSVEYEVFDIESKTKLELDVCNETKIDILLPVSHVEKDLFKHNASSEYYKDICYTYTTDTGTDIILNDRKNEFMNNHLSLCDSNCEYKGYNINTKMSKCECSPKNEIPKISEISFDKDKLLSKFVDFNNIMNIKSLKCYKLLFTKEGIIKNIGSYIILFIIIISIISNIIFLFKGFKYLCNIIEKIINFRKNANNLKKRIYNRKKTKNEKSKKILENKKIKINKKSFKSKEKDSFSNLIKSSPPKLKRNLTHNIYNLKNKEILINNKTKKKKRNGNELENLNDQELNTLDYKKALLIDKRTYLQYYISQIKRKQKLIFTFFTKDDYNSRTIKICLFFFSFALFYTVNALFFSDSTMHKIYEDNGKFNFIYQIPQILYSTLISSTINVLLNLLSLSESNIILLKQDNKKIPGKKYGIINCLKIKFIIFYILVYIFLFLFWYYLSCFCAVYKNTQLYLIKDLLISFLLSLLYPFGLSLLPGLFRIPSLRAQNQNKGILYKISQIVQLI